MRVAFVGVALAVLAAAPTPVEDSILRAVNLNIGETAQVKLADGKVATIKLVALKEDRDPLRGAVRRATVTIEVNGQAASLVSANYRLPQPVGGVQVDCPITKGYNERSTTDHWSLRKDARLRLWPAGSPWIEPGTFMYPVAQRWFASQTQMANEPTYVDNVEPPGTKPIYYHSGLDVGGAEGLIEIVAATDGLVVSRGTDVLKGFEKSPAEPRYDVVYLRDDRGWFYRYSHMQVIDAGVRLGERVKMGQKIGLLGKEGGSGGWSHQHFEIKSRQPSGEWGTQEGYAFLWEAYIRQFQPKVIAVARPHLYARVNEPVTLDGARSWTASGQPSFEWTLPGGGKATTAVTTVRFAEPGTYSIPLRVSDADGYLAYDFAIVQVIDPAHLDQIPPSVHLAFSPTRDVKAGQPVTFKTRTFRSSKPAETIDFGDGTPPVVVHSDGNANSHAPNGYARVEHTFAQPGDYLVRSTGVNERGQQGTASVHVRIEP